MTMQTQLKIGDGKCECCGNGLSHDQIKGYLVCDTCGAVHDRVMVNPTLQIGGTVNKERPPASQFGSFGERPYIVDGMGSYIGHHTESTFFDATNRAPLSASRQRKFRRLKYRYEMSTKIGPNEPLYRSLKKLNLTCSVLGISNSIRNEAADLLQKAITLMKKEHPDMFLDNIRLGCTCLIAALRNRRSPFSDHQVLDVYMPSRKPRYLSRYKVWMQDNMDILFYESAAFKKWIPKIISDLERSPMLTDRIERKGENHAKFFKKLKKGVKIVADELTFYDYVGKNPRILAASLCYVVSKMICPRIPSQNLYGKIAETAENSIRDHQRSLWKPYFAKHNIILT